MTQVMTQFSGGNPAAAKLLSAMSSYMSTLSANMFNAMGIDESARLPMRSK